MPTLNIADLTLAIIWLFFSLRGYLHGLVKEVGSLAALATGFYCAGTYHKALAPHLTAFISGDYADTAAYLLIFTVALLGVWFLALVISGIVKITMPPIPGTSSTTGRSSKRPPPTRHSGTRPSGNW